MKELISVIVPVYKSEKFLNRCVESILNQSYENLEIILVDDASLDSCPSICDNLKHNNPNIRVIHNKKNLGTFRSRIEGIKIAGGQYITFVDSDDFINSDMFSYLHLLIKKGDYQVSACSFERLYNNDKPQNDTSTVKICEYKFADIIKNLYLSDTPPVWSLCGKLFSQQLFTNEIKKMDFNFCVSEDFLLIYYLTKNASKAIFSSKKLYYYYRHPDSAMGKPLNKESIEDSNTVYKIIEQDIKFSPEAHTYHIANIIKNDFRFLTQIIRQDSCHECYDKIRKEVLGYKKYAFLKQNSDIISFKNKLSLILLEYFNPLYILLNKLFVKLKGKTY